MPLTPPPVGGAASSASVLARVRARHARALLARLLAMRFVATIAARRRRWLRARDRRAALRDLRAMPPWQRSDLGLEGQDPVSIADALLAAREAPSKADMGLPRPVAAVLAFPQPGAPSTRVQAGGGGASGRAA